jgi:hypothetical protein
MCRKLYYFVQGKPFEYAIMCAIVANSALMATAHYKQPEVMTSVVESINYAFTGIYLVEFCLKVGAWRGGFQVLPTCVRPEGGQSLGPRCLLQLSSSAAVQLSLAAAANLKKT